MYDMWEESKGVLRLMKWTKASAGEQELSHDFIGK